MNRLKNTRGYLCGAMDFSDDFGTSWRVYIREQLQSLEIVWLDPTNKPMHDSRRGKEEVVQTRNLMRAGEYTAVEETMKDICFVDIRLVNISDFVVMYIDKDIHHCGTYEEFTVANMDRKPIIAIIKQGKEDAPTWLLGRIPHELIFSSINEAICYLKHIAHDRFMADLGRWLFFSFHGE